MTDDVRRLFFALWPDAATRPALAALARSVALPAGARRVHPADLHLTLQFLGPVPAGRLPSVLAAAAGVSAEPVDVTLTRVGCWRRARVAWLAPDDTPSALAALVGALGDRLAAADYPPEARPFRPHVTVARKIAKLSAARLAAGFHWRSLDFALVESLSLAAPPRYRVLATWSLEEKRLENKKRTN
jgi:2'-5' RNA ligase